MKQIGTVMLAAGVSAFVASANARFLSALTPWPNRVALVFEHDPDAQAAHWQALMMEDGAPVPEGGDYVATVCLLKQHRELIKVAGSPGRTPQDGMAVRLAHIYVRPCPPEQVPPQMQGN